jgi:hypothetical protein
MSEVEITNIGGRDGAASEATLQRLLDATTKQGTTQANAARQQQRLQENYNKAVRDGDSIMRKTFRAAGNLTKEFLAGGNRLSDFSQHLLGANSRLSKLIDFAEGSVDQFRSLSQVGASFNNSIIDMNIAAATSGMRLDEFYTTVQDNSEVLRLLGGTVTRGAQDFVRLSKSIRSGDLGQRLFDLGFTVGDVNEGFLAYVENQAIQGRLEGMTQRQLIRGSQEYLQEIDLLTKATGRSRDALIDQTKQLANNAQFQSLMARAGAGAGNLTNNLAAMAEIIGPAFTDDLIQMANGTGELTDLGKALANIDGGQKFLDLMENAANLDPEDFLKQAADLGPDIAATIRKQFSPEEMRLLREAGSPIAAIFDVITEFERLGQMNLDQVLQDQRSQDRITSLLTNFENSVSLLKKEVIDKIINSALGEQLLALGTSFSNLFTDLFGDSETGTSGAAGKLSGAFDSFTDSLVGEDGTLTNMVKAIQTEVDTFTGFVKAGGDPMYYIKTRIEDMLLGAMGERGRSGGLLEKISNGFTAILDGAKAMIFEYTGLQEGTGETVFQQMINKVTTGISDAFNSEAFQSKMDGIVDTLKPIMQDAIAKLMKALNDTFLGDLLIDDENTLTNAEKLQKVTSDLETAMTIYGNAMDQTGFFSGGIKKEGKAQLDRQYDAFVNAGGDISSINLPEGYTRRVGTLRATGRMTEPKDTVAKIHAGERVLNASEAAAVNDLPGAIKQLNTLTAQVRDLMAQSVQYQERTARGIKSLGSDMMA